MRTSNFTTQFKRDLKRAQKQHKDIAKLKELMSKLIDGLELGARYRDHALVGNWQGRRECYIEPDWLLIYKLDEDEIVFERTGTHTELFD